MDFSKYQIWPSSESLEPEGIVVGADQNQEWLLPWWWDHYCQHNRHPVAFIDFGLSLEMKEWCEKRGRRIRLLLPDFYIQEKEELPFPLADDWEKGWGQTFWNCRKAWFKKPLACLQTPYAKTIWFDLDCEIRCSVKELFLSCRGTVAMIRDQLDPSEFNSGVIVYPKGAKLIEDWARDSFTRNGEFRGDQDLLSRIIQEQKIEIAELPSAYNRSRRSEEDLTAKIIHWHGPHGKSIIAHQIQKKNLESLYE